MHIPSVPALAGGFFTSSATWEAPSSLVGLVKEKIACVPIAFNLCGSLLSPGSASFCKDLF